MAAFMAFVVVPVLMFGTTRVLALALPDDTPIVGHISDVSDVLVVTAFFGLVAAIPAVLVAGGLRRTGWIGPIPVIATGAALGAGFFLYAPAPVVILFAGVGAFYAGICWLAVRLLRRDVFVVSKENHIRNEISPFD